MSDPEQSAAKPRTIAMLTLGAALGVAAAGAGLVWGGRDAGLPSGAVASVNGTPISADAFARLVAGFESDTREAATPELRQRILDRLVEEELLVQRGLELGLATSDRRVRADIVQAMIRSAVVESESEEPSKREVAEFYAAEREFFASAGRVRIAQLFVRVHGAADDASARERADAARSLLASGRPLAEVRASHGSEEVSAVPDALLPPAKLREYVGPTVLRTALDAPLGVWTEPVRSGTGYHVVSVLEREASATPPLDEIREQVKAEWVRRSGDRALRRYLDELREDADVRVAEMLP